MRVVSGSSSQRRSAVRAAMRKTASTSLGRTLKSRSARSRWISPERDACRTCQPSSRKRRPSAGATSPEDPMMSASLFIVSFEIDEAPVAAVAAGLEDPFPFLRRMEGPAGQLPIHQVHLLALVAIGLVRDVAIAVLRHALDLANGGEEIVDVEIVQRIHGHDEVEALIGKRKLPGICHLQAGLHLGLGIFDCISGDI